MTKKQFATFYVDGRFLGIEVTKVQEVMRCQEVTRVPLAQNEIHGLINLRGQIVTAMDLRERLQLSERTGDGQPMNVVVRSNDGAVSLLVDEIGDVLEVDESSFERPPDTLQGTARNLILGAYKLNGCLLLELNTEKVVEVSAA